MLRRIQLSTILSLILIGLILSSYIGAAQSDTKPYDLFDTNKEENSTQTDNDSNSLFDNAMSKINWAFVIIVSLVIIVIIVIFSLKLRK